MRRMWGNFSKIDAALGEGENSRRVQFGLLLLYLGLDACMVAGVSQVQVHEVVQVNVAVADAAADGPTLQRPTSPSSTTAAA
jgi:hypothetical protein